MDNYVVFDLETTGFSAINNEIVEIGAWKVKDSVVVSKFSTLVKPLGYFGRDTQKLTGITLDMLEDACTLDEILPSFIEFCVDLPLLGYNLGFDYDFVCEKSKQMGYDFTLNNQRSGIDVLALCRRYVRGKAYKLKDMAEHFGVQLSPSSNMGFHRAEYDAYVTKLIYDRFIYSSDYNISDVGIPTSLSRTVSDSKKLYGKAENYGTLSFE